MTAVVTPLPAVTPPAHPPAAVPAFLAKDLTEGMRFSEMICRSRILPAHLQGNAADCFLVLMQAQRWAMDFFAVAQETNVIKGRMMYGGKLVAAVINTRAKLKGRLGYEYAGEGDQRTVVVSGTFQDEAEPRSVTVRLRDARTDNRMWQIQPDQQLAYFGARVWARRYVPELMLGVYAPEDFPEAGAIDVTPMPAEPPPAAEPKPAELPVKTQFGEVIGFPRTTGGLLDALGWLLRHGPQAILNNPDILELAQQRQAKHPQIAERLADCRTAVDRHLSGAADDLTDEALGADLPDAYSARHAAIRGGAVPPDAQEVPDTEDAP